MSYILQEGERWVLRRLRLVFFVRFFIFGFERAKIEDEQSANDAEDHEYGPRQKERHMPGQSTFFGTNIHDGAEGTTPQKTKKADDNDEDQTVEYVH
jgi:hypothetical protein